jgi:hypothetical protein
VDAFVDVLHRDVTGHGFQGIEDQLALESQTIATVPKRLAQPAHLTPPEVLPWYPMGLAGRIPGDR